MCIYKLNVIYIEYEVYIECIYVIYIECVCVYIYIECIYLFNLFQLFTISL